VTQTGCISQPDTVNPDGPLITPDQCVCRPVCLLPCLLCLQRYPRSAEAYNLAVGCALIAGEGLWGVGKGLLGAFGVAPPICMSFTPAPSAAA